MLSNDSEQLLRRWLAEPSPAPRRALLDPVIAHARAHPRGGLRLAWDSIMKSISLEWSATALRPIVLVAFAVLAIGAGGVFYYGLPALLPAPNPTPIIQPSPTVSPSPTPSSTPTLPRPTAEASSSSEADYTCPASVDPDQPGPASDPRPPRLPGPRSVAIDTQSGDLVGAFDGSIWLFDLCSNAWRRSDVTLAPGGAVYDSAADRVVIFGGYYGGDAVTVYDADTDTAVQMTGTAPYSTRWLAAYDPGSGLILARTMSSSGLWTYDLATDAWDEVDQMGDVPPAQSWGQKFAFDTSVGRLVLVDDGLSGGESMGVYEFDPTTSTWVLYPDMPGDMIFGGSAESGGEIAFDESQARTIVASGGTVIAWDAATHVWETAFTNGQRVWSDATPDPRAGSNSDEWYRFFVNLAYDPVHERTVSIGGNVANGSQSHEADDVIAFDFAQRIWVQLLEPTTPYVLSPSPSAGN